MNIRKELSIGEWLRLLDRLEESDVVALSAREFAALDGCRFEPLRRITARRSFVPIA